MFLELVLIIKKDFLMSTIINYNNEDLEKVTFSNEKENLNRLGLF
jgi:hypothetical protein